VRIVRHSPNDAEQHRPRPGPGLRPARLGAPDSIALRAPYVTRAGEKAPFSPKMGRSGNQEIRNIEVLTIARRRCKVKIEPHPPLISVKQESRLKCQGCVRSRMVRDAKKNWLPIVDAFRTLAA